MSKNFLSFISEYSQNPQQVAINPQTVVEGPANGETRNWWNPQRWNPQSVVELKARNWWDKIGNKLNK